MVITSRVRTTFFVPTSACSQALIRLPPSIVVQYETKCQQSGKVIATCEKPPHRANIWSSEEHERFLHGLELWPNGPWKEVAAIVGTKTTRQTMTHAQKYRQKIERRLTERPRQCKKRNEAQEAKILGQRGYQQGVRGSRCMVTPLILTGELFEEGGKIIARCETNEYVLCSPTSPPTHFVSSPMEVSDDVLDSTRFDQEFDDFLKSLAALPTASDCAQSFGYRA